MKKDKNKTAVKFYINEGELFAYFPNEIADGQFNRLSYAHIGQHSACSPDYANESKEATAQEYAPLQKELEQIGYNLNILNS